MFFAVLVNSSLMTVVFMLSRMVIRKLSTQAGLLFLTTFWMSFELLHLHWIFRGLGFNLEMCLKQPHGYNGMNIQEYFVGVCVMIVNILFYKAIRANEFRLRKMAIAVLTIAIPVCISLSIYANYQPQNNKAVEVIIAQPNIDPYEEKFVASDLEQAKALFALIKPELTPTTDLILALNLFYRGLAFLTKLIIELSLSKYQRRAVAN